MLIEIKSKVATGVLFCFVFFFENDVLFSE